MYNSSYQSGYSKAKLGWSAKKMHKPEEKGCGYFMKMVFFFSSLIQSLIIVSLVLFLVYGQPEQTIEEKRVQELEQSYINLNLEKKDLLGKIKNLTNQLNVTKTAKMTCEKSLNTLRNLAKNSSVSINALHTTWRQCEIEKRRLVNPTCTCTEGQMCTYGLKKCEDMLKLVQANFTEKMATAKLDLASANKAKLEYHLEAIELRRGKASLEERIKKYEKSCKEDFIKSLQGIPNVTREFLKKVDDLFKTHDSFQLTCDKQSTKLEDIRVNCSRLSKEVENKLQSYLDKVGSQVSSILGSNAKYQTENKLLTEDAVWCKGNLSATIEENQKVRKQTQLNYDEETEKLLLRVRQLSENSNLQQKLMSVKEADIKILNEKIKTLNISLTSCQATKTFHLSGRPTSFQWPTGSQMTGMSRIGQGTPGSSNVGTINSGVSSGTSLYKTLLPVVAPSVNDQFSAQINQHLRELQRYTKTD